MERERPPPVEVSASRHKTVPIVLIEFIRPCGAGKNGRAGFPQEYAMQDIPEEYYQIRAVYRAIHFVGSFKERFWYAPHYLENVA